MKSYPVPVVRSEGNPYFSRMNNPLPSTAKRWAVRFIRQHGILIAALLLIVAWSLGVSAVTAHRVKKDVTEQISAQYAAEYEKKINAFYDEQAEAARAKDEASRTAEAQMQREAEAIARVIGTMNTKRMKGTLCWNILCRVDNPLYPGSVEEVIEQPSQWVFYRENNPISEDDVQLALEQLRIWHDGRYPAGLSSAFVYGEWSEYDYVIRDTWDKHSRTNYWRFPE